MHLDLTQVLIALIAGLPGIIAAIAAMRVHSQIKTPSGDSLGTVVERTHDLTAANTALMSKANGHTKDASQAQKRGLRMIEPQVPDDAPDGG